MHNRNIFDKAEYFIWNYIVAFAAYWVYNRVIFKQIGTHTYKQSLYILILMLIFIIGFEIFITWKWDRSPASLFINSLIPYGMYTGFAYGRILSKLLTFLIMVAGLVSVIATFTILHKNICNKEKQTKILRRRKRKLLLAIRINFSIALTIFMGIIGIAIYSGSLTKSTVKPAETYGDEYLLANNIDIISLIRQEEWEKLNLNEKTEVLQTIANTEGNYLGISVPINVTICPLDEHTLGGYSNPSHDVKIDLDHVLNDSSDEVVNSLLHEIYHLYQRQLVEVYNSLNEEDKKLFIFYPAAQYAYEFDNYISGEENAEAYYNQMLETDARKYAQESLPTYHEAIDLYLKDK